MMRVVLAAALLVGCASKPQIEFKRDARFGTPYPCVDGVCYELTDAEHDQIGSAYALAYCPVS